MNIFSKLYGYYVLIAAMLHKNGVLEYFVLQKNIENFRKANANMIPTISMQMRQVLY